MNFINPPTISAPLGHYTNGILVPKDHEWLYIAGQVGVNAQGITAASFEEQAELCWSNLLAVLDAAGMGIENLVKTTVLLCEASDMAAFGAVRNKVLGSHKPASTVLVVKALAKPEWQVEIEAVAAR